MKSFILSLIMSLFPFFSFAQSYDKLWKQVENYEDDGKPQSAYEVAEKILKKASRDRHIGQALSARLKMAALHQEWSPDSFFTDIQELEALRAAETRPEARAVYASLLAEIYQMNKGRSQASGLQLTSDNMKEWTREQYDSAAFANWRLSMEDLPMLAKARSKDWLPFIKQNEHSAYFKHDLLHILWYRAKNQDENIWKGTQKTLASLAQDIVAEYKRLGNREAALLISLDWIKLQQRRSDNILLRQLIQENADLPLCVEAYLDLFIREPSKQECIALARECISRYPKYARIGEVRNRLNRYLKPSISWQGCSIYYPGKEYPWTVKSSNAKRLTFEIFQMPPTFHKTHLYGGHDKNLKEIRQTGTCVQSFTKDLSVANPWDERRDTVPWTAPEPGTYALIITGEASEAELLNGTVQEYSTFICTRLQPLYQNGLGQQRTVVVDAESGQPIEGAVVEYYDFVKNEKRTIATVVSDREGRAPLDNEVVGISHISKISRKVTYGNDVYLDADDVYFVRSGAARQDQPFLSVRLYSDRAIYRPGQDVHVGGILFWQEHWDATVLEGVSVTLTLRDANGKEVSVQTVKADEYGKFNADFQLPQGGLPGDYRVSSEVSIKGRDSYNTLTFSVEEYKRPTFEVKMDPAPDMQWPADSITLTGKAMGYNGVPVREGRVTGTFQFTYPYWWWRHSDRDSEPMPIDTVSTDENGSFSIRVPLKSLSDEALWGGLRMELNVDVLSVAGETHEGHMSVPISRRPLRIILEAPEQQEREHLQPIGIELLSSTGQNTDGTVTWSIYPASEKKRVSDEAVSSGVITSKDKHIDFDIEALRTLEAGQYELYVEATAGEYRDSTQAYFLIFGMDDTKLPKVTPDWMYCPDETFGPGKPGRIQVGSSLTDIAFYYTIVSGEEVIEERLISLSDELRIIEIPYEERFGDGASFNYVFVKGGRVYKGNQTLRLVAPDRTLKWEWKTFRDRLHPGDTETWTLLLRTPDGKPASAQAMVTLYDASLDALAPHAWNLFIRRAYNITDLPWTNLNYFTNYGTSSYLSFNMKSYDVGEMLFDEFDADRYDGLGFGYRRRGRVMPDLMMERAEPTRAAMPRMMLAKANGAVESAEMEDAAVADEEAASAEGGRTASPAPQTLRTNFNETAAFLPRLQTNGKGEVSIKFTLPESLTTWRLLGIAHTKDLMSTTFQAEAVARKEMMARLFLPRFLRAEDHASVRATIQNLTDAAISGNALLEIFDPETDRILLSQRLPFTVAANGESLLTFDYTPTGNEPVVAVRLTADSKTLSDGEQHYLPILPSKTYLTESVEIRADSLGTFTTDLTSLFNHNSPTATNRRLTVEYTAHPIWYALQALPSLIEPQHDDILSLCTSLQAQALSAYIANNTPRLKTLVEIWQREQAQGQPSLASKLAEDEELKQIILDETPWLREAENEADRKQRLIQLFNISRQENVLASIAERMEKRLHPDGGYSWFPGMPCSEMMTRVIATELSRLRVMTNDFETLPSEVKEIINRLLKENIGFIAGKTAKYVQEMKDAEKKGATIHTASMMYLEYVYTTQHAGESLNKSQQADVKYLLDHMKGSVADMNNWERAIAAVVMKGAKRNAEAKQYYESLIEHTTTTADHGTFFDYAGGSFNPTSHKIIHHVAAMEAVQVMEPGNKQLLKGLRRWLLQQKRTQMWESNICTVDAIYALLTGNSAELNASEPDDIKLNYASRQVDISRQSADKAIAGLGFIKQQFTDGEAPKSITVQRRTDSEGWGAVFATFLTPMTDANSTAMGLGVRREVITTTPKVGDRFTTRYVITADRDYEYVNLRAPRAACAEPAEQLSGYHYQGGLGYYRAVRDAHTDYFFDHLPKGTYVLEETTFIDRSGSYTSGLTTIRCLYAPEYGGNTPAVELTVE